MRQRGGWAAVSAILAGVACALWMLPSAAHAVGFETARGNNKLFAAMTVGNGLEANSERFNLTTMTAGEGITAAVESPASQGSGAQTHASFAGSGRQKLPGGQGPSQTGKFPSSQCGTQRQKGSSGSVEQTRPGGHSPLHSG